MARTIQSPGVEIREVDFTIRAATVAGTSVFIPGFADQGPIDEVLQPSNISEFEQIYGAPTNAAEQYFYQTAKATFQSPARVLTTRLPYGSQKGEGFTNWRYSALVYPVKGMRSDNLSYFRLDTLELQDGGSGYLTQPEVIVNGGDAIEDIQYTMVFDPVAGSITSLELINRGKYATYPVSLEIVGTLRTEGTPANLGSYNFDLFDEQESTDFTSDLSNSDVYLFGTPTHLELDAEQYQQLQSGDIQWLDTPEVQDKSTLFNINNIGSAGLIVLNKSQTTINNTFEGYYIGIIDNNNNNPATPFNGVNYVKSIQNTEVNNNTYINVPRGRLNFSLSAANIAGGGSVSEVLENLSQFDLGNNTFDDTVSFGLFKIRKSIYTPDTISLDYTLAESYVGSFDFHRKIADQTGGPAKTFFIGEQTDSSSNVNVVINPYVSNRFEQTWADNNGIPNKKVRFLTPQLAEFINGPGYRDDEAKYISRVGVSKKTVVQALEELGSTDALFAVGVYSNTIARDKSVGNIPKKLERAFELVENADVYQINLAVEAGLGTIFVNAIEQTAELGEDVGEAGDFRDSTPLKSLSAFYTTNAEGLSQEGLDLRSNYTSVANVFVNAAEKNRKDFMVILDPLRNIFVQGANSKVINTKKTFGPNAGIDPDPNEPGYVTTNFSQHIYWPLRHQFSTINSSYATTYSTCVQVIDSVSSRQIWVPFSGFAAALMANTDSNFQPWFAPAGFTRGILTSVNDLGVYPKLKQRDQLYKVSVNPVAFFPAEGFVVFGQKTLLKKPSAFDRINVRRLFLNLEVATRDTVKYFIFEPNTLFTRTQIINTLSPIFDNAKNTEGLYDYLIVCDERNNTPDVIDNNELKIDIYIKPVRTAEFILVSFYATRTGQDFNELIGG